MERRLNSVKPSNSSNPKDASVAIVVLLLGATEDRVDGTLNLGRVLKGVGH